MDVSFSGLTPGFVGLYQVNAQMPSVLQQGATATLTFADAGQTLTYALPLQ